MENYNYCREKFIKNGVRKLRWEAEVRRLDTIRKYFLGRKLTKKNY